MKIYKDLDEANKAIIKLSEDVHKEAVPMITQELLKDSNVLAPLDTGTLKNSGVADSDLEKGTIQWLVSYAKKVWETNRTGVPKWGIKAFDNNHNKYQRMYTKVFNDKK